VVVYLNWSVMKPELEFHRYWTGKRIIPDFSELAKAMLHVGNSLDSFAKSARQRAVMHFDVEPWKEKHAAIFQDLLQKKAH
jgi:hypothetical protein